MPITRRNLGITALGALTTTVLAACSGKEEATTSSSPSSIELPTGTTPVKHPEGLNYGTWLREDSNVLDAGTSDAVLVEFLDFECPVCAAAFTTAREVRDENKGKLTFAIRHFPLKIHEKAKPASYAAEAAARQGKLEAMCDLLYLRQEEWVAPGADMDAIFKEFAKLAGLDVDKWEKDRNSQEIKNFVDKDEKDARELGLDGTPTFFLNGEMLNVATVEDFKQQIQSKI